MIKAQALASRRHALLGMRLPTVNHLPPPKVSVFDGKLELARSNPQAIASTLTTSAGLAGVLPAEEIVLLAKELLLCSELETKKLSFIVECGGKQSGKGSMRGFWLSARGGV